MSFDPILQIVQVHPTTKSGSTVATVKLWVDEAVLNSSTSLIIEKLTGLIQHNFSELVVPHFSSHVQPLFEMSPSENSSISSISFLYFDSATLPGLTASSMERCAVTSSAKRYVAISIDLKLLSDSLYHLGDHNIYMSAVLFLRNQFYAFTTLLKLRVEAGLINLSMSLTLSFSCQLAHLILFFKISAYSVLYYVLYWVFIEYLISLYVFS